MDKGEPELIRMDVECHFNILHILELLDLCMSVSVFINLLKYVVNMSDEKHNAGNEGTFELYVINVSHHIPLVDRIVLVPDLTTFLNLDFFFPHNNTRNREAVQLSYLAIFLCIGTSEQRMEDNNCLIEIPHKHPLEKKRKNRRGFLW